MKTPHLRIWLTTLMVVAYLAGGLTLWVNRDQLEAYIKNDEMFVMDGFTSKTLTEKTFRLMNYIHDGNAVEFDD